MKNTNNINFIIDLPLYEYKLNVFYNYGIKDLEKTLNKTKFLSKNEIKNTITEIEKLDYSYSGLYVNCHSKHIILINKNKDISKLINTISHEVLHFVFALSRYISIKNSEKSEEFFTYLQGYITSEIFKKLFCKTK